MHVIKPDADHYKKSRRSSAGAEKWVEVHHWDTTKECLTAIKQAGYKILVRPPLLALWITLREAYALAQMA